MEERIGSIFDLLRLLVAEIGETIVGTNMKPRWRRISIALLIVTTLLGVVYEWYIAPYRFADLLYAYATDQMVDSYNQVGGLQVTFDQPKDDNMQLSEEAAKRLGLRVDTLQKQIAALENERIRVLGEIEQLDQIKGARIEALSKMLGQNARQATFFSIVSGFFTALILQWLFQNEKVKQCFMHPLEIKKDAR